MNTEEGKCADCGQDDDANTQTCNKGCSVKLFGVQIGVPTEDGGAAVASSCLRKSKSTGDLPAAAAEEPSGYLSDGVIDRYSKSRKRGKPWSEAEHRSFLEGLEKLGKGDWKGISTKFVPSRKSSQVASHAQKYFNRLNMKPANRKRRRGSVFDIALPHYDTNQPSQSNNGTGESLHIATTSAAAAAAASKNVGAFKPSAHVTSSEKPPLSPRKLSEIPDYLSYQCQPTIYWVPMLSYPRQNSNGRFAAVMPQRFDGNTFPAPSNHMRAAAMAFPAAFKFNPQK